MADSTNPFHIPVRQFNLVAGYVDGAYAWTSDGWSHHGGVTHVRIACFSTTLDADVLDVEAGCSTVDQAGEWLKYHVEHGEWRVLYFSQSLYPSLRAAVLAHGVGDDQWGKWVANWDGVQDLNPAWIAKQFANPALSGGHYDLSTVADFWPGVDVAASATHLDMASWLRPPVRSDIAAGIAAARWFDVFGQFLKEQWSDFLTRADVAPSWTGGKQREVYGQWLIENAPAFWARPDVQAGVASGDFVGQYIKEQAAVPAPAPAPAPTPGPPIDQARAAWARLGELFVQVIPDAIVRIEQAVANLKKLP